MIEKKRVTAVLTVAAGILIVAGFSSHAADKLSKVGALETACSGNYIEALASGTAYTEDHIEALAAGTALCEIPVAAIEDTKITAKQAAEQYQEKQKKEEAERLAREEAERLAAEEATRAAEQEEAWTAEQEAIETVETVQSPTVQASASEQELLAALIFCEAGNQPYEGQVAVGAVVMNRVRSSVYPNSITEVIYQSGQFTPAMTGWLDSVLAGGSYTESAMQAAADALAGNNPVGDMLYFDCGGYGYQIGDHFFH